VHKEFLEGSGDNAEYTHITEEFPVGPPTLAYLARLKELQSATEKGEQPLHHREFKYQMFKACLSLSR